MQTSSSVVGPATRTPLRPSTGNSLRGSLRSPGGWAAPRKKARISCSGHVTFSGTPSRSGRYEFGSHSGHVRLSLAGSAGFELNASTFSGSIRSDIPVTLGSASGRQRRGPSRRSIRGIVGEGGAVVSVTTFSGDIIVERR